MKTKQKTDSMHETDLMWNIWIDSKRSRAADGGMCAIGAPSHILTPGPVAPPPPPPPGWPPGAGVAAGVAGPCGLPPPGRNKTNQKGTCLPPTRRRRRSKRNGLLSFGGHPAALPAALLLQTKPSHRPPPLHETRRGGGKTVGGGRQGKEKGITTEHRRDGQCSGHKAEAVRPPRTIERPQTANGRARRQQPCMFLCVLRA